MSPVLDREGSKWDRAARFLKGSGLPVRVHGAFVSDEEVHRVVADWKRRGQPDYIEGLLEEGSSFDGVPGFPAGDGEGGEGSESDALYESGFDRGLEIRWPQWDRLCRARAGRSALSNGTAARSAT